MHINTVCVIMYCISFHPHISVASATNIENTNSIQILARNVSLKPSDVKGTVVGVSFTILHYKSSFTQKYKD